MGGKGIQKEKRNHSQIQGLKYFPQFWAWGCTPLILTFKMELQYLGYNPNIQRMKQDLFKLCGDRKIDRKTDRQTSKNLRY